jgi:hypothetical protein
VTQRTPEVGEHDAKRILACLKNAAGSVAALQEQLEEASGYYREIIAEAAYPNATRRWSRLDALAEVERQSIFDKDWRQYQEWLHQV